MLIEQIIVFELKEPGPPGLTCIPTAGYFHDKTKISKNYIGMNYFIIYCKKFCRRQCNVLPPIWAKSVTNFNPKMQDFKRVLDCKLKED